MLATANSLWTLLNFSTMKPANPSAEHLTKYPVEPKLDMAYAGRKITVGAGGAAQEPVIIRKQHLDSNNHVNNGQYINIASDYLPEGFEVHQIRAEYKKQALLGDVIVPKVLVADQVCIVVLCNKEDQVYATVEFRTERQREKE